MSKITNSMQAYFDSKTELLSVVEDCLRSWQGEGCYQIPDLLQNVQDKMGWGNDDVGKKLLKDNDPIIRDYIRQSSEWCIERGAKGGVMRRADKLKKEVILLYKKKMKDQIEAELNAKVAALKAQSINNIAADSNPTSNVFDAGVNPSEEDNNPSDEDNNVPF